VGQGNLPVSALCPQVSRLRTVRFRVRKSDLRQSMKADRIRFGSLPTGAEQLLYDTFRLFRLGLTTFCDRFRRSR